MVQMAGTTGQPIEIRCVTTATLAHSNGDTINLSPIKVSLASPQAYNAATDCAGGGVTVLTGTLSVAPVNNVVYLGGQLDIAAASVSGAYNTTTNAGGVPITLTVIFN
jgi:hypothetical protein